MGFNYGVFWCELGGAKNGFFKRNIMYNVGDEGSLKFVEKTIKEYGNTDIYQCIYSYENKNINEANVYAPMYFDLDGEIFSEQGFDKLKKDVCKTIFYFKSLGMKDGEYEIYFSGSKGFHIIIPAEVLGIKPDKNLNEIYKIWAQYLHDMIAVDSIDLRIYDRRRLFRIPGSINSKTGLYKILIDFELFKKLNSFEELKKLAKDYFNGIVVNKNYQINPIFSKNFNERNEKAKSKKVKKVSAVNIPESKQELLPCVKEVLKNGVGEGGRNNTLAYIASAIMQSGYQLEETVDILQEWNLLNDPPLEEREVTMTIESVYKMLLDGKKYGCSSFKENGYCIDRNCRLGEERK
jgi:hypothetical protein